MNIKIKYTQPQLIAGQVIKTAEHTILCHDVDTHPNGQPVADGADYNWDEVLKNLDGAGVGAQFTGANGAKWERIAL